MCWRGVRKLGCLGVRWRSPLRVMVVPILNATDRRSIRDRSESYRCVFRLTDAPSRESYQTRAAPPLSLRTVTRTNDPSLQRSRSYRLELGATQNTHTHTVSFDSLVSYQWNLHPPPLPRWRRPRVTRVRRAPTVRLRPRRRQWLWMLLHPLPRLVAIRLLLQARWLRRLRRR